MADLKIRCDKCGSELTYKPGTETLVCAYCGNTVRIPTQVVNPEDITDTDLIIPLQIQGDALTNATRVYMTQGQFTPDDLVQKATITKQWLKYVPFYLYHGEFHANWTASFGYNRREGSGSNSRTVTDWRPASGTVSGPFSLLGYAGNEVDRNCADLLADQDRSKLVPYDAKFMTGFPNDKFALSEREAYQTYVEDRVAALVASEVKANAQGDEQKDWHWSGSQSYETKTLYLPVGLSVFEYEGKEYKVWVDGVDPTRFTGDPLPVDDKKQKSSYYGWIPFGLTLVFSIAYLFGKDAAHASGWMGAALLLTALYALIRKFVMSSYSKKLRKAFLTQVQAADIDTSHATQEQLAEISKSYKLPEKPFIANTANDKFILPILSIAGLACIVGPGAVETTGSGPAVTASAPARAPKTAALAETASSPAVSESEKPSESDSAPQPEQATVRLAPNVAEAIAPYPLAETSGNVAKMLGSMSEGSPFVQTYANQIRELPLPPKEDRKTARALNAEGLKLVHSGDASAAVDKFADAVKADPTDVEAVENLGFALMKDNRAGEAAYVLIAALALDPNRATAWFNFGDALARDGHESDAPYAMMVGYRYCNAARQQKTKQLWKRLISDPGTSPEVAGAMKAALSMIQQRESGQQ